MHGHRTLSRNNFYKTYLKYLGREIVICNFHECRIIYPEMKVIFEICALLQCIGFVHLVLWTQNICVFIYYFRLSVQLCIIQANAVKNCIVLGAIGSTLKDRATVD